MFGKVIALHMCVSLRGSLGITDEGHSLFECHVLVSRPRPVPCVSTGRVVAWSSKYHWHVVGTLDLEPSLDLPAGTGRVLLAAACFCGCSCTQEAASSGLHTRVLRGSSSARPSHATNESSDGGRVLKAAAASERRAQHAQATTPHGAQGVSSEDLNDDVASTSLFVCTVQGVAVQLRVQTQLMRAGTLCFVWLS